MNNVYCIIDKLCFFWFVGMNYLYNEVLIKIIYRDFKLKNGNFNFGCCIMKFIVDRLSFLGFIKINFNMNWFIKKVIML